MKTLVLQTRRRTHSPLAQATMVTASYKIGDVSRLTGLSIDTVRFYEKQGLLGSVRRKAGIRRYEEEAVRRLEFVRRSTALGFTLAEIRGLLRLRVSTHTSCERVRERALDKLADIERRITVLERMRCTRRARRNVRSHDRPRMSVSRCTRRKESVMKIQLKGSWHTEHRGIGWAEPLVVRAVSSEDVAVEKQDRWRSLTWRVAAPTGSDSVCWDAAPINGNAGGGACASSLERVS